MPDLLRVGREIRGLGLLSASPRETTEHRSLDALAMLQ